MYFSFNRFERNLVLSLCALCIFVSLVNAGATSTPHGFARQREIDLASGHVLDTRVHPEFHEDTAFVEFKQRRGDIDESDESTAHLFYVHFASPFDHRTPNVVRDQLSEQFAIDYVGFVPENTMIMHCSEAAARQVADHPSVQWVGAVMPHHKMPQMLHEADSDIFHKHKVSYSVDRLIVSLVPSAQDNIKEVAARLEDALHTKLGLTDAVVEVHHYLLRVIFPESGEQALHNVADFFAHQSEVHWVEPEGIFEPRNKWTRGVLESGEPGVEPLTTAGFDGSGEVIGLGDTGIDMDSCFFADSVGTPYGTVVDNHRTLVSYHTALGDDAEATIHTHGTFCAGQLVGDAQGQGGETTTEYSGGSTGAKLFFVDLNLDGAASLNIPPSPDLDLFPVPVTGNGYLQVYPWGSQTQFYSALERAVDSYANDENGFLGIFSAGNNGKPTEDTFRIEAPSGSKNGLSVGASISAADSMLERRSDSEFEAIAESVRADACGAGNTFWQTTSWCAGLGQTTPCVNFKSIFCDQFQGSPSQLADQCCTSGFSPLFGLCCKDDILSAIQGNSFLYSAHTLTWFSSIGPTPDGRIKPDVVAPGQRVFSAAAHADCDTIAFIGTSYSASALGSAAAIVRQWLRGGNYVPVGGSTPETFEKPSSALIKAMLINSGQPLRLHNTNDEQYWTTLSTRLPTYEYGFGRVQLNQILELDSSAVQMLLVDSRRLPELTQDEGDYYTDRTCIVVTEGAAFIKVTVVWVDPPAIQNAGSALIQNLDLAIIDEEGYEYRSNFGVEFDNRNNVEQVHIILPRAGRYSVMVHPTRLGSSDDLPVYSMVITGQFGVVDECHSICPLGCGTKGRCTGTIYPDGICQCTPPYGGLDCTLTPCDTDCSSNGVCDGETGKCVCDRFWKGSDCSEFNPTGLDEERTIVVTEEDDDLAPGIVAGIAIACFAVGFLIGGCLAAWLTVRFLLKRQKKRIAQFQSQLNNARQSEQNLIDRDSDDSFEE
eukprot:CAMPEP_0201551906 /NCGR_PEP_ID=MMETSP0173_2-20130828/12127_1 /ASSEMBLY_ACC=CAM_ASM_000268 /TAXON_ID=218659 /ORGANISM="Vexillifera sp., Strain DIVA3 564/2" /LENGTH=994 /DNA_ID=CAMNT_0047962271 /DNA_START=128 /DNA_END=3112 /DNA_ORIENTATION=+